MDTLKILLGATVALLLGALAVSVKTMRSGVETAPAEDVSQMRQQLREIELEMERLKMEKERLALQEAANTPLLNEPVTRGEAKEKVSELEARMLQLEAEAEEAKLEAEVAEKEAGFLTERYTEDRNKSERRARVIREAMKIAVIREWVDDPNFGGFAVLEINSPENVQSGSILAIRRNDGILGKLRVGEITIEGAVANPTTAFGDVKPQPGDELILDEVVQLAN